MPRPVGPDSHTARTRSVGPIRPTWTGNPLPVRWHAGTRGETLAAMWHIHSAQPGTAPNSVRAGRVGGHGPTSRGHNPPRSAMANQPASTTFAAPVMRGLSRVTTFVLTGCLLMGVLAPSPAVAHVKWFAEEHDFPMRTDLIV